MKYPTYFAFVATASLLCGGSGGSTAYAGTGSAIQTPAPVPAHTPVAAGASVQAGMGTVAAGGVSATRSATGTGSAAGSIASENPLGALMGNDAIEPALRSIHAESRRNMDRPIVRRPLSLEELKASGLRMKYPQKPIHLSELDDATWELTALSFADIDIAHSMSMRLPRMAATATLTGDSKMADYVTEQLAEIVSWQPLQRPGWSLRNEGRRTMPPGGDGAWLGTGWMIRGITEAMHYLPEGAASPELQAAVTARLEAEITSLMDDWNTKRQWFFRAQMVGSNQWVMPHEALVLACLYVGKDRYPEAYETGIANLTRTLDSLGDQGEFVEGLSYAAMTLSGVISAAVAAAEQGDMRLMEHPFLQNFPQWFAHHIQPGGEVINAFDMGTGNIDSHTYRQTMALFAVHFHNPVALWALYTYTGFPNSIEGALARTLPESLAQVPPLYKYYPVATRVNWRDNWEPEASGFWMRGGHVSDMHDHMDRGHVNFIVEGRPVLIEAGKPQYDNPRFLTHFKSVAAHNVLQVGAIAADALTEQNLRDGAGQILRGEHRVAPMEVLRLDDAGGKVRVDASNAYASVEQWVRTAEWDARQLVVEDSVQLNGADVVQFRWLLWEEAGAPVLLEDGVIRVGETRIEWRADALLEVSVESMPSTAGHNSPITERSSVVFRTAEPVQALELWSRFSLSAAE